MRRSSQTGLGDFRNRLQLAVLQQAGQINRRNVHSQVLHISAAPHVGARPCNVKILCAQPCRWLETLREQIRHTRDANP